MPKKGSGLRPKGERLDSSSDLLSFDGVFAREARKAHVTSKSNSTGLAFETF